MNKAYRLALSLTAAVVLLGVSYYTSGNFSFLGQFWFASGLLLLVLLSLIDQPHFSKDANVFINATTALMSLLLVENRDVVYWCFLWGTLYLLASSYALLWLRQSALQAENIVTRLISRINRDLGKPETLFSAFFLWGVFSQFGRNSSQTSALFVFWTVFMVLNLQSVARSIEEWWGDKSVDNSGKALGQIFGVQSKNTFLVKLIDSSRRNQSARLFDFVEFHYSSENCVKRGLVIDIFMLDREQWLKVLSNAEIEAVFPSTTTTLRTRDIVYAMDVVPDNNIVDRLVGVVTEHSRIGNAHFIYNSRIPVEEGALIEISVHDKRVLYQIAEGTTRIEALEKKNQNGFIVGEAFQLGTWNTDKLQFEQLGWVPMINSPVFMATDITQPVLSNGEYVVGNIPQTNYPATLDKAIAMSHHMAVVGVTGSGKSVFCRNLIRQFLVDADAKVICVDFTGEYAGKFEGVQRRKIVSDADTAELFKKIDEIEGILGAPYGKENEVTKKLKKEIFERLVASVEDYLKSEDKLAIFELPEVENTSGVFLYTRAFFKAVFSLAKKTKNFDRRVCLVLEEAHTVIPEWNFSGASDKSSQSALNSIAQIALQGRKYNVGLLVIAQRTANVSKTILTQCNTVVAFQQSDKTSAEFLTNYLGQEAVVVLPRLKSRHAIGAGKAFRSSVPMIFEVPELDA